MKFSAAVGLAIICLSSSGFADDESIYSKFHMEPLNSERLSSAIFLSGSCSRVSIVEWKITPEDPETRFSVESQMLMSWLCQKAIVSFRPFMVRLGYRVPEIANFHQTISLLPADLQYHGAELRNLNDISYRFFIREKQYDQQGFALPLWGFHHRSGSHIYLLNEVKSARFKTVWVHELFHALSFQFGTFGQHPGDANQMDEKLARKFTKFLQLGE